MMDPLQGIPIVATKADELRPSIDEKHPNEKGSINEKYTSEGGVEVVAISEDGDVIRESGIVLPIGNIDNSEY